MNQSWAITFRSSHRHCSMPAPMYTAVLEPPTQLLSIAWHCWHLCPGFAAPSLPTGIWSKFAFLWSSKYTSANAQQWLAVLREPDYFRLENVSMVDSAAGSGGIFDWYALTVDMYLKQQKKTFLRIFDSRIKLYVNKSDDRSQIWRPIRNLCVCVCFLRKFFVVRSMEDPRTCLAVYGHHMYCSLQCDI